MTGAPSLRVRTLGDLLDAQLVTREPLLDGLLRTGESAMLWAASGVGKTWASLSIAAAVGGGGAFLGFTAPVPRRVLLVDGEMHLGDLQERFSALLQGDDRLDRAALRENVFVLSRQDQDPDASFPDIATPEGQAVVMEKARTFGAELVILDNFSTLAEVADENDAAAMNPVLAFLLKFKQAGIAVLLVHHSGKSGAGFRGSSKLETTFEVVVGLQRASVSTGGTAGAAFDMSFTKFRGKPGETHEVTTAWLEEAPGGGLRWASRRSEADVLNRVVAALRTLDFPTQVALADHLRMSTSELSRKKAKAIAAGVITALEWAALMRAAEGCAGAADAVPETSADPADDGEF